MAEEHSCASCPARKRYDDNPRSLLGRLWRWHTGFCPGFRKYITSLPDEERREIAGRYGLRKYAG
jgi:hypothetical protein